MSRNNDRPKALEWWRSLSEASQKIAVRKWREITSDSKRDWPFELIAMSSNMIEQIWNEVEKAKQ